MTRLGTTEWTGLCRARELGGIEVARVDGTKLNILAAKHKRTRQIHVEEAATCFGEMCASMAVRPVIRALRIITAIPRGSDSFQPLPQRLLKKCGKGTNCRA